MSLCRYAITSTYIDKGNPLVVTQSKASYQLIHIRHSLLRCWVCLKSGINHFLRKSFGKLFTFYPALVKFVNFWGFTRVFNNCQQYFISTFFFATVFIISRDFSRFFSRKEKLWCSFVNFSTRGKTAACVGGGLQKHFSVWFDKFHHAESRVFFVCSLWETE